MPKFFRVDAAAVPRQVTTDFQAIAENAADDLAAIDATFGRSDLFVPYYVTPDAQNLNPADQEEDDTGLVSRTNVFQMLDKYLVQQRFSHTFVLSDAGMGKTSLMVILKLAHIDKLIDPAFDVVLLKLGPTTIGNIGCVKNPAATILLLDALDEDPAAWGERPYDRLQELLQATKHFRKVIITCRTQFFAEDKERDGRQPGVITLHGFPCSKLFLSPFDDDKVTEYLQKRFTDTTSRDKAHRIVGRMKSLEFRPMLLAYIDFLLEDERSYDTAYDLYESLVDRWLLREVQKGVVPDKTPLLEACSRIANSMYRLPSVPISQTELAKICAAVEGLGGLPDMTIEGRSLLQRTSLGTYKFAHYSIVEFFVARSLIAHGENIRTTDQVKAFLVDRIQAGGVRRIASLDLSGVLLSGLAIKSIEARDVILNEASLLDCKFPSGAFNNSSLRDASVINCDFSRANLTAASLPGAELRNTVFSDAILRDVSFREVKRIGTCDFRGATIDRQAFAGARFSECGFGEGTLSQMSFEGSVLEDCKFMRCVFAGCSFEGARMEFSDFTNARFDDVNLKNANLHAAILDGATFAKIALDGTVLDNAILVNITMEDAIWNGVSCRGGILRRANLRRLRGVDCNFEGALLEGAILTGATIKGFNLTGATCVQTDLERVRAMKATADGVIFDGANLKECDLSESQLERCSFSNADLSMANLTSVIATRATFDGAKLNHTNLTSAHLAGANLSGLDLSTAKLSRADLTGADLSKSVVKNLERAKLVGARLRESILIGANLVGADCSGTEFSESILRGAQASRANFHRALFGGASLTGATLEGAVLTECDLSGCDLTDAKMDGAVFTRALADENTRFPAGMNTEQRNSIIFKRPA